MQYDLITWYIYGMMPTEIENDVIPHSSNFQGEWVKAWG